MSKMNLIRHESAWWSKLLIKTFYSYLSISFASSLLIKNVDIETENFFMRDIKFSENYKNIQGGSGTSFCSKEAL